MRDPYEVLGVPRGANAAAIKSAYRKLAKKHHPDSNKNDPKAAARFSEINSANEILGDEDKRKQFDRGEIDADGKPRFQGFPGGSAGGRGGPGGFESYTFRSGSGPGGAQGGFGGGGFEDILNSMFGGARRARGAAGRRQSVRVRNRWDRARPRRHRGHDGHSGRSGQRRREARPLAERSGNQRQDTRRGQCRSADPRSKGRAKRRRAIGQATS